MHTGKLVKWKLLILHGSYKLFVGIYAILGLFVDGLRVTWDHLGHILGHPDAILELSWESWGAAWVQGHLAEMPTSLSLGPCAANTLAWQHTSAHRKAYEVEQVVFTHVLLVLLNICIRDQKNANMELLSFI